MEYVKSNLFGEGYPYAWKMPQSQFEGLANQLRTGGEAGNPPYPFSLKLQVPGENRKQRRARERSVKKQLSKSKGK